MEQSRSQKIKGVKLFRRVGRVFLEYRKNSSRRVRIHEIKKNDIITPFVVGSTFVVRTDKERMLP